MLSNGMMAIAALLIYLRIAWALLLIATHISLTIIVFRDAKLLQRSALGISPFLWLGITFSLPIIGMFIYWIMNYSSLSKHSLDWHDKF